MALSMREIIKQQISDLRKQGYSLVRAGQILETIDRADKGRNVNEIKRVVGELKTMKTNPRKKKSRARYKHKDLRAPSTMAKGSIRTKRIGKKLVRVGCPKGPRHYNKKTGRCKVGTRAVSILSPNPTGKTFRVFAQKTENGKLKHFYWDGENFNSNYTVSVKMTKEAAIRAAKSWSKQFPKIRFGVSDGKA